IILVVGAFNDRSTGAPLAKALESQLTVLNYDRRGRGASGDTQPYAVEREVDDLDALIRAAGGAAHVFGSSSGATLALEGAARGLSITKLTLYAAPFVDGQGVRRRAQDVARQVPTVIFATSMDNPMTLFRRHWHRFSWNFSPRHRTRSSPGARPSDNDRNRGAAPTQSRGSR